MALFKPVSVNFGLGNLLSAVVFLFVFLNSALFSNLIHYVGLLLDLVNRATK